MTALHQNYYDWLAEHDLLNLLPIIHPTMNGQGYGDPKDMPALYGLMWNHPNFITGGPFGTGHVRMLREGFQTLWERLIASTNVDLKLGKEVKSIRRSQTHVEVTYKDCSNGCFTLTKEFDWLVMAAPMPQSLPIFADASAEEKTLFGAYNFHELVMTQFNVSRTGALPSDFEILAWADRLPKQTDYYRMFWQGGKLRRDMYDSDGDDGPTAIRHTANIKGFSERVAGVLQISDIRTSDSELTKVAEDDAQEFGVKLKFLHRNRWDYLPHYSLDEVARQRKPWRVWSLQGQRRTWWVGSHTAFESVADVVDYNLKLVNARLCK